MIRLKVIMFIILGCMAGLAVAYAGVDIWIKGFFILNSKFGGRTIVYTPFHGAFIYYLYIILLVSFGITLAAISAYCAFYVSFPNTSKGHEILERAKKIFPQNILFKIISAAVLFIYFVLYVGIFST